MAEVTLLGGGLSRESPPIGKQPRLLAGSISGAAMASDPSTSRGQHSPVVRIVVYGDPAPQGSKRFVGMRGGHGVMIESSKKVKPWRQDVKAAALEVRNGAVPLDGPLAVSMVFTLPKPASAPKRRRLYPMRKPDLSKLVRSTEDALTDAGIWADDARVVEYERLAKVFPGEDPEALEACGAVIEIRRIEP